MPVDAIASSHSIYATTPRYIAWGVVASLFKGLEEETFTVNRVGSDAEANLQPGKNEPD
ncbi:MAG: hypothetical protein E5299_02416 [Burkholderia gladioli]|nr:MAG: hypothetical protein E5299_02416 [Burkholderia gladioli]